MFFSKKFVLRGEKTIFTQKLNFFTMKRYTLLAILLLALDAAAQRQIHNGYPITPVPFTAVKVSDSFWGDRLSANRTATIPLAFAKCEENGRYDNFVKATRPDTAYEIGGFPFDDTDVYKIIEGASYSLQTYPDKKLVAYIDSVLTLVERAQESDGYLYTARTLNPKHPHSWAGARRWSAVEDGSHELYNLGHMVEGAIAHYQATGNRKFLDIAIRYADCVCREIGDKEGQILAVPGHQIAEMALAKLYLTTGDEKYLKQAKFFLDRRGRTSHGGEYSQAHKPVVEQTEAVGHAVRAVYMYSGMADVAALTGDTAYIHAIDRIWENIVSRKLYITGGIGATSHGEAFGRNYELPNFSAYCETCASIGFVFMNSRMFLLHGDAKYFDVLERTLYNALIAGISLDGTRFFYPNPLASNGGYKREPWFGCACCPSNVCRFIPSLPGYVYAVCGDTVYVNLYMANKADVSVGGKSVKIEQRGNYVWNGDVSVVVNPRRKQHFVLKLRIPEWAQNRVLPSELYRYADARTSGYTVEVDGEPVSGVLQKGYLCIERVWEKGDSVTLKFDMSPRLVTARREVSADRGRTAVERGPIVYCAEWCDNEAKIPHVLLNDRAAFTEQFCPDKLHGIVQLSTEAAQQLAFDEQGRLQVSDVPLTLIPYYAWAHRGEGDMAVWLPCEPAAVQLSREEKTSR